MSGPVSSSGWRASTCQGHPCTASTVELSARELGILEMLMEHAGQVVSRSQLEAALYGWGEGIESNAVEVHIHHLRKKLGSEFIRTLRGIGYMVEK